MGLKKVAKLGIVISVMSLSLVLGGGYSECKNVYAQEVDNDFDNNQGVNQEEDDSSDFLKSGTVPQDDIDVGDFIKNQRGTTGKQLKTASKAISPLTNILGVVSGGIIALASAGIFIMTAFDLIYIAVPPVRPLLYAPEAGGAGMGGMGGYGGRYGGMYGGGMMGGQQQQQRRKPQLISDECVQVCASMGVGANNAGMGGMGGMGGYGGRYGGMMGGGMMGGQQAPTGSVIYTYLKKRVVFIVIFAVCTVILMSSVLLGTGVNLAQWGIKILDAVNNMMKAV